MQFIIASIQIVYKLQIYINFFLEIIKTVKWQYVKKIQEHQLIKPLSNSKTMQYITILINSIR